MINNKERNKMSRKQENVIREKRIIEATKKNLMGPAGKFGIILQAYGTPIIKQGSSLFDQGFLNDMNEDDVYTEYSSTLSGQNGPLAHRDEILYYQDEQIYNEGLIFDGLNRGFHLEIVYWDHENKLKVSYKGYVVYLEIAGELESYAPFDEWENIIDKIFINAKQKAKSIKIQKEKEISDHIQQKKKNFLKQIRLKWGI